MKNNVLVVHGGGPTSVMNASLYGVLKEAERHSQIGAVYGAIGGVEGILKENLLNLSEFQGAKELLLHTPGSAIGSSRYLVTEEDYNKTPIILKKYNIKYILPNGGNGTMDTCGRIYKSCIEAGYTDIKVVGIPKTIDNDIAITDHTPGFGSAARYLAATVREVAEDVKSLPIHVCIIEALGRNAGWITAASVLARRKKGDAPHLIYTPERPFKEEEFLTDVKKLYDKLGGVVVVVSEGLKKEDGTPVVDPIYKTDRAVYYGDVSAHLANLVIKRLGIKARNEKPGLCGRASIAWQSPVDCQEAQLAGEKALEAAIKGHTGVMIGFKREKTEDGSYKIGIIEIPIEKVMLLEKTLPDEYINVRGNDITEEYIKWLQPLVGPKFEEFLDFKEYYKEKE